MTLWCPVCGLPVYEYAFIKQFVCSSGHHSEVSREFGHLVRALPVYPVEPPDPPPTVYPINGKTLEEVFNEEAAAEEALDQEEPAPPPKLKQHRR